MLNDLPFAPLLYMKSVRYDSLLEKVKLLCESVESGTGVVRTASNLLLSSLKRQIYQETKKSYNLKAGVPFSSLIHDCNFLIHLPLDAMSNHC